MIIKSIFQKIIPENPKVRTFIAVLTIICSVVGMLQTDSCDDKKPSIWTKLDSLIIESQSRKIDSLLNVVDRDQLEIEAALMNKDTVEINAIQYVTQYRILTDTVLKLATCDSMAVALVELKSASDRSDSIQQAQRDNFKATIAVYDQALDSCVKKQVVQIDPPALTEEQLKRRKKLERARLLATSILSSAVTAATIYFSR
jgi:hypothetical protein